MAIQMTREEYTNTYGVTPNIPAQSEIDSVPTFSEAPVRMTRAEYSAKYNAPTADEKSADINRPSFPSKEGDSPLVAGLKTVGNIPSSALELGKGVVSAIASPIDTAKSVVGLVKGSGEKIGREILERTGFEDEVGKVEESETEQSFNSMVDFLKNRYVGTENLQRTFVNDPTGTALDVLGLLTGGAAKAGKLKQLDTAITKTGQVATKPVIKGVNEAKKLLGTTPESIVLKRSNEIFDIESGYAKNRKINDISKDGGDASRQRIAATDVLVDAVDENGLIRTKQKGGAVDRYRKETLDGFESVVRQNLDNEGATVNLAEIKRKMDVDVSGSRLEGADLVSALNKINKEIAGLSLRADEFGNLPLTKLHDAKINATRNIDFTKKVSADYRRTISRSFKEIVEKKSKTNVKAVNAELAKFYDDINRLENLDGRRVKGGKLGKYFAQITGNVAGAAAGSALGPLGMVGGTIVGGEVSALLKSKTLANTFGKELGLDGKTNKILETAKDSAKAVKSRNLKTPDVKVGAAKNIEKTPEIHKLEKDIDNNVKAQKKAIKAGDFTLVTALKEIYDSLVESLVETIKGIQEKIKNTPNKEGGFVKIGKADDLVAEAKKHKTADEFVAKMHGSATQYGEYSQELRLSGLVDHENISKLGVSPDESVTIYRGIDDIEGKLPREINEGDFVTTDFDSALSYTGNADDVVSIEVPAKHLYVSEPRDFVEEPFYVGAEYIYTKQDFSPLSEVELKKVWEKANN